MGIALLLLVTLCMPPVPAPAQDLPLSTEERIYGLSLIWSEVKHNFVYYDRIPFDWDSLYRAHIPLVTAAEDTYEYYRILRRMVARLGDAHTGVSLPRAVRAAHERNLALRTRLVEDRVLITDVLSDSLARAGFRAGMEIVAIDGVEVHQYARERIMPEEASSTPQDLAVRAYRYDLWLGPAARPVRIRMRDARGRIVEREADRTLPWDRRQRAPVIEFRVVGDDVGLLVLNSFSSDRFNALLDSLYPQILQTRALVIDIRANDGGSSAGGYYLLGHLVDEPFYGTHWYSRQHLAKLEAASPGVDYFLQRRERHAPQDGQKYAGPVALLIGPATFSAAEDFAATFDYLDLGPIVGMPSGGSSGEPVLFDLPGGGRLRVVTEHDVYPDGREFVGIGVLPDIEVDETVAAVREGKDPVLEAAIEALRRGR